MEMVEIREFAGEVFARFSRNGDLLELRDGKSNWLMGRSCPGWSIRTRWSDVSPKYLYPAAATRCDQVAPGVLRVVVEEMRAGDGVAVAMKAELEWRLLGGLLQGCLISLELPAELQAVALAFPDVPVSRECAAQWVVPEDIGLLVDCPGEDALDTPGTLPSTKCVRHRAHMQFTAWLCGGIGLYLDSRDSTGWMKSVLLRSDGSDSRICIEHLLPQPDSGRAQMPDYPVSVGVFTGGWYEAARKYKPWARCQKWACRGPAQRRGSYIAETAGWLWNRGPIDSVCPAAKEVARRLGLPIAVDWYWWHKKPYDSGYPDYFPPREGEERFKQAVCELQRHNVSVQVYTNGMSWDKEEEDWETEGRHATIILRGGEYFGVVYNTWMNRCLMHTCGASEIWHRRALKTAADAAALGLDGLYMDQISVVGGMIPCFSDGHGHVPGGGDYGIRGFRTLLRGVRDAHPGLLVSSESVAEVYQDLLDACITLQTSWERCRGEKTSRHSVPIPLFQAVYHGYSVVFGNYAHIDGVPPYDDLWPREGRPDPRGERDWHRICPDQFSLELARTVAFGCQPLATNLTLDHLQDPEFAEDVAFFLDLCRFYHAHRDWLLWGDMLPPGELCCNRVAVTCIQRTIFTRPETIVPFTVERPAVFHGAWLSESGAPGLVLINYTRESQSVTIGRKDGLMPDDGRWERCLRPRSASYVSLSITGGRHEG